MANAVLILDMPDNCADCNFLNDNYDYLECIVTGETRGYTFNMHDKKMDKCPLRLIPEKVNRSGCYDEYGDGYADGWNACLEEIIGEK